MAKIKKSNVKLEMLVNSKPYKDSKSIAIQYALGEGVSIKSYSVKSEGLDLSKAIDLKDQSQTINLSLKGDKGCISIVFTLSDSTQETVKLFAVQATKGVYFSRRSYEQAERISLQGELTAKNYVTEVLKRQGISITPLKKARTLSVRKPITSAVYKLDVQWTDSEGKTHPARRLKIGYQNANNIWTYGYTDNNGHLEFSSTAGKPARTLIIYSATDCCNVSEVLSGEPHSYGTGYPANTDSYRYTIQNSHSNKIIDEAIHAIQITQALTFGYDYVLEMSKNTFKQKVIQVVYPNERGADNQTSYYSTTNNSLHIYESAYLCWDILLHELGHLLQNEYNIADNPGGRHNVYRDQIATRNNKDEGIRLAWAEAWPTTFGLMVTQYYNLKGYPRVADTFYDANNGENNKPTDYWRVNMEENRLNPLGEGCELDVYCVLYDMYDSTSEAGEDNMSMSHVDFWNLVTRSKAKTLSDFVSYAYKNGCNNIPLYQILSAHGIAGKILSLEDKTLSIQVGGNPASTKSRQNKAIVYYANYSKWETFKTVTTDNLKFNPTNSNKTSVSLPLKEIYQDIGAKLRCCLGTWQTEKPSTGVYYAPWVVFDKKRFLSNAYFFPTDDFSFLTKRATKWQNKSVQINSRTFTVQGYNVIFSDSCILMNIPGSNSTASVRIQSPVAVYGLKYTVLLDIPSGYTDILGRGSVILTVTGIKQDNKTITLSTKRLVGNALWSSRKSSVKHYTTNKLDKGVSLKEISITVTTSKISTEMAKKIKVSLGNILLSSSSTMPDFF